MVMMASKTLSSVWMLALVIFLIPSALTSRDPDGVPYPNDIVVQKHLDAQGQLITFEKKQRQDHLFRQSLSSTALLAADIVSKIRVQEIHENWTVAGTPGHEDDERFAGEMFLKARPYILGTNLYKVIRRMPKGALLHAHLSAMVPYGFLFQTVLNTPGMMISSPTDLASAFNLQNSLVFFSHSNSTSASTPSSPSIWTSGYVPNTKIPVSLAADTYPGGRPAFLAYLKSKTTLSVEESLRHDLGVDAIWRRFQSIFSIAGSAMTYEPIVRAYLQQLFSGLADDGINWVEIRNGGSNPSLVHENQETADPDPEFWFRVMVEEINKFKATDKGKNFWGVKIIWSASRGLSRARIIQDMKNCITRKKHFPDLISGYDLVAQEDLGRPLSDLAPELLWFQEQTASQNLSIPFFFHAGETLGDGNSTDNNMFDALLFSTRRIGHGFALYKHPRLMDDYIERDILVEVCPISNEVLRLNTDILHHPLPAMIAHGVPTALSNDDPSIEGQDDSGLSFDFYEAIQAFENLGLAGLGALAQNSVRWSNFEDQSDTRWLADIESGIRGTGKKAQYLQQWHDEWEVFCQWIVAEFGALYNSTTPTTTTTPKNTTVAETYQPSRRSRIIAR